MIGKIIVPVGYISTAYQGITVIKNNDLMMQWSTEIKISTFKKRLKEPELNSRIL